jgi:hypothetical protein
MIAESGGMPRALLVTDRHSRETSVGAALARAGFEVYLCPGPQPPNHVCVGGRGGPCPLADAADVVVLDAHLASDEQATGTTSWDLLGFYRHREMPVVVLAEGDDLPGFTPDGSVLFIPHRTDPGSVAAAARRLLARR